MATNLGTGTPADPAEICMLFTDIEGSTNLVDEYGDTYTQILSKHNELLWRAIQAHDGEPVRKVGDSVFAIFPSSGKGVQAAIEAQCAIDEEKWAHGRGLKVRMGLHKGAAQRYDDDFVGIEVHRAARIASVGHGGQIVISNAVRKDIKARRFEPSVEVRDLGFHRLKDLRYPEALFDLIIPGLPHEFAPLSSIGANRTNLSTEPVMLFGREGEIEGLKRAILKDRRRLVTLTGTGGAGKTSLALAVGQDLVESFARGVFMVQLGEVNSPDLIASAICQTLGIQELAGVPAVKSIENTIGDGEVLLLLDTFEHLISGANVILELLKGCPNLSVIVTSREVLGIGSESQTQVIPLPVPAAAASHDEIARNASVQLFLSLARRERPDFELTTEDAEPIARICRRLDGLPLAIGLAASHLGLLAPAELEERLKDRLPDLRSKSRLVDPRHRTLRSTIEWSDNLLPDRERRSFYGLSVFSGGFNIEAAESVLNGGGEAGAVLQDLESLASKSLLFKTTALGRPRLSMLDTIREYANEQLQDSEAGAACQERHARYFTDLALVSAPHVLNRDQRDYVERLFQESGNVRAALRWLTAQASAAQTAKLLESLKWFWVSRGLFSEAERWTGLALRQVRGIEDPESLAAVLDTCSWIRYITGDAEGALGLAVESHDLYRELDHRAGMASSGIIAGIAKTIAGQQPEGPRLITESLELFRALGDDYGTVVALITIGEGIRAEGDEAAAEKCYKEALSLLDQLGNTFWPGHLLQNLAHFRLHEGDGKAAAKFAAEALAIAEEYDYPMVVNLAVAALSGVLLAGGDAAGSTRVIGAVEARLQRLGSQFEPTDQADFERIKASARKALGAQAYASETAAGAAVPWEEALALARSGA